MDNLQRIDDWLAALLAKLTPAERKALLRGVARDLRKRQQERIRLQQNPDGTAFEPRRVSLKDKKGRIRRQMFSKLRAAKYLKASATATEADVGFIGSAQRLARVHHYGLRDRVREHGPVVKYAARQLLGMDTELINHILNKLHVSIK
ncbi:phage virion morphogenesis protein [Dickeya dianthicola]|uniref:Phage virion morphogenesis protein n=2 Tax=Dickeya dianthicola TaxID=204039 RepID=A0AAX1C5C4_9GAMM|nr:phage virion morphogenesis protein [Dickeya dianthicola]ATO31582.1 Phage tail completion protein [Dickeya dianthicola RNS04.9]MBT1430961.1 phage virion morphogenesis protein [Dickeya dianthicola]MCA7005053.1 phage virion morphogenesis protein [Dickeya dianthicola]MCI4001370.1 phage virion morphogenesis protein [Dickeya dianthicola]MCI4031797.1 phage virion morphogenesis protein [Dickeya dianthicola]